MRPDPEADGRVDAAALPRPIEWDAFVAEYDGLVRGVARRWLANEADVDDCVQDVWADVLRMGREGKLRPGALGGLLGTIARRKAQRAVGRAEADNTVSLDAMPRDVAGAIGAVSSKPLDHMITEEAIDRLPPLEAAAYRQWRDGLGATEQPAPVAEVAEALGIDIDAAYKRIQRARKALARQLTARKDWPTFFGRKGGWEQVRCRQCGADQRVRRDRLEDGAGTICPECDAPRLLIVDSNGGEK